MPEISIVLPSYNGDKYIRDAVDSILKQTFGDWELIIVNDCSTDGTAAIAEEYAAMDPRIQVIHNTTNQKLPESLNIGFRQVKGKFLTWTSDDNAYLPEALETMYRWLLKEESVCMVCADMALIDWAGQIIQKADPYNDSLFARRNSVGACFLYRAEVLREVGEYHSQMIYVEDYEYWLRIKMRYGRIGHISKTLYLYRCHPESLTEKKQQKILSQLAELKGTYIDFFLENLQQEKRYICQLYYELQENAYNTEKVRQKIFLHVPELCIERYCPDKRYYIFGAGEMGAYALDILGPRAVCFVDNDAGKSGTAIHGKAVISFDEMLRAPERHPVFIAVYDKAVTYDIMHQLYENSIREYCSIQYYKAMHYAAKGG